LKPGQEIVLSGTGLAILVSGIVLTGDQNGLTPAEVATPDPEDVNPFDRGATRNWSPTSADLSNVLQIIQLASPAVLAVTGKGRQHPGVVLTMYAETLLLVNGFAQLAKGSFSRTRPYPYNDNPEISEELKLEVDAVRSFPSGHTIAATTGILRYTSGKHFPTDILTGALVGSTVGFVIPRVHEIDTIQLGIYPSETGPGLSLTYRF
jgi:membrane-associated phospholipid phosphatase